MAYMCFDCGQGLPEHPARAVACPSCGAPAHRPCKRPSGHAIFGGGVHAARVELADREGHGHR